MLVRVHSECLTGDVFGSLRCDCGLQLDLAQETIAAEGEGVIVYLRGHEGRGMGLGNKMHAYSLQDQGYDTVEANVELGFHADSRRVRDRRADPRRPRRHHHAAPHQQSGQARRPRGLRSLDRRPACRCKITPNDENIRYLRTKQEKLGHLLEIDESTS